MPLLIHEETVRELLSMEDALAAVEEVFRLKGSGKADNRPRQRPRLDGAMLQAMAGAVTGFGLGLKAYTITPSGVRFAVLLFDDESGELCALIEANELGRIRTGAASGVATKYLARADATTAGIFGAGYQAETQLEAVCVVRSISAARIYSRTEARARAFAERMSDRLGIAVEAVSRPEEAAGCDVVTTITNAAEPLFAASMLSAGAHVNAAGSNRAEAAEVGADTVARAQVVAIDDLAQGRVESGDLIRAVASGEIAWEGVTELGDLVGGKAPGRSSEGEITLFESQGIAIEDIAAARIVYDRAVARGAGDHLPKTILGS